jgi:homoserine O-acetyltransferase
MQEVQLEHKAKTYTLAKDLDLEGGGVLHRPVLGYTTYGRLNNDCSNVIWIFHALTGSSDPVEWWPGMFGPNGAFDTERYYIVCMNMPGSCYGSISPESFDFPLVTIRDMIGAFRQLAEHLAVGRVKIGIGGSMGGQLLLQWATDDPDFFETLVPIATNAFHSPWGIAFNEAQRMALRLGSPEAGMEAARAMAMLSYRSYQTYKFTQKDEDLRLKNFSASSYQNYQGKKLSRRFSPYSYYALSRSMDSHHLGRHATDVKTALLKIKGKTVVIGIKSDLLFPMQEQEYLAQHIPHAKLYTIDSIYGHDGFLVETEQISQILHQEIRF